MVAVIELAMALFVVYMVGVILSCLAQVNSELQDWEE